MLIYAKRQYIVSTKYGLLARGPNQRAIRTLPYIRRKVGGGGARGVFLQRPYRMTGKRKGKEKWEWDR